MDHRSRASRSIAVGRRPFHHPAVGVFIHVERPAAVIRAVAKVVSPIKFFRAVVVLTRSAHMPQTVARVGKRIKRNVPAHLLRT